jgi:hypothetical protein
MRGLLGEGDAPVPEPGEAAKARKARRKSISNWYWCRVLGLRSARDSWNVLTRLQGRLTLARPNGKCHPAVMDEQLCACGKRPKRQCPGDEVKVALLRVYYYVRQTPGEGAPLQVIQGWWCLQGGVAVELLTDDSIMNIITEPSQQSQHVTSAEYAVQQPARKGKEGDSDGDTPEKMREATATYLTDCIDQGLGGTRLDDQLWASSSNFLPGATAEILDRINTDINTMVSGAMEQAFRTLGEPSDLAAILSGIGTPLVLESVSMPIEQTKKTIEVVGLFIAVLTLQPALAVACVKAIAHDEITSLIEKAIVEAISPETAAGTAEDTSGLVSSPTETAEVKDDSVTEKAPMREASRPVNDNPQQAIEELLKKLEATNPRQNPLATGTSEITTTD